MGIVVAIDGPSGSGKSTVSKRVASRLGLAYLDTGAMYRAAAWWCEHEGIDLDRADAVARAVEAMPLEMGLDPESPSVVCGGEDITTAIRDPRIATVVSRVATNLDVRAELARLQRELIHAEATGLPGAFSDGAGVVAEGRDITTVIAPDADARLLVTASQEARLTRRAADLEALGKSVDAAALRDQVLRRDRDDASVSQFLTAPDGVTLVDTSDMDLPETVEHVIALIEKSLDEAAERDRRDALRAEALRGGLSDYELEEEDLALLDGRAAPAADSVPEAGLPVLAVVGRPNVGKSTLVNRVLGRRAAVVQDTPGVTRDRVSYPAEWAGRRFTIVDTGGWETDVAGMDAAVASQAEAAVSMSDAVVLVVDARVGITETDARVVRLLRRSGRPVVLAANKVDSPAQEGDAAALWNLGLGEPYPVSALHGRGSGEVLDAAMGILPEVSAVAGPGPEDGLHRIALVGRPNVGKSSLLNAIAGRARVVVDDVAGTTRDPVDEVLELDGRTWVFVDTAGVRRRVRQARGADYYAVLRTRGAIEKADSYRHQQFLDRKAIAPSAHLKFSPDTQVLLQAEYLNDRRVTDFGIPAYQGRPVNVDPGTYYGAANARDADYNTPRSRPTPASSPIASTTPCRCEMPPATTTTNWTATTPPPPRSTPRPAPSASHTATSSGVNTAGATRPNSPSGLTWAA